jgi:hypothetical protein
VLGERALRKLYTTEQRALYRDHAPDGIELDDLAVLGPIFVLKLKWKPRGFARKMVAEMWLYPDGARIFELSTRCLPSEAFQVAAEVRVFLNEHGIDLSGEQQTKTHTALEFFAAELAAGGAQSCVPSESGWRASRPASAMNVLPSWAHWNPAAAAAPRTVGMEEEVVLIDPSELRPTQSVALRTQAVVRCGAHNSLKASQLAAGRDHPVRVGRHRQPESKQQASTQRSARAPSDDYARLSA